MIGKVELDSTLSTVPTACRRSSPTLEKSVFICLRRNADWSQIVIADVADSFRSYGNQALSVLSKCAKKCPIITKNDFLAKFLERTHVLSLPVNELASTNSRNYS